MNPPQPPIEVLLSDAEDAQLKRYADRLGLTSDDAAAKLVQEALFRIAFPSFRSANTPVIPLCRKELFSNAKRTDSV